MTLPETVPGRLRSERETILEPAGPSTGWSAPVLEDLPKYQQPGYLRARAAVQRWERHEAVKLIQEQTGLSPGQVLRLVKRCVAVNPATGRACGFWACVPGWRAPVPRRLRFRPASGGHAINGESHSGHLQALFLEHPAIEEKLTKFVRTRTESGSAPVSVLTPRNVHDRFLALCKEKGRHIERKWPFNKERRGYEAVRRWFRSGQYEAPLQSIRNELGDEAAKAAAVDFHTSTRPRAKHEYMAYERVELDEHRKDAFYSVLTPLGGDRFATVGARRVWGLAMRDVGSTAILSTGVAYGQSYNKADVLSLVHRALAPPGPKTLMLENEHFRYDEGACFPGQTDTKYEQFRGNFWQVLAIDRHSTHFSDDVLRAMEHAIGCHIDGERVGQPTARHTLERWFAILAEMSKSLPSATGNNPRSPARRKPEEAAERFMVVAPLAEHLLDVMARNYNVTPSSHCGGISPLQRLSEMVAAHRHFPLTIGALRQENLFLLLPRYPAVAGRKRGKNRLGPLGVNLFGGRYVGPTLAADIELAEAVDKSVWVYVQEDACHAYVVPVAFPTHHHKVILVGAYSKMWAPV